MGGFEKKLQVIAAMSLSRSVKSMSRSLSVHQSINRDNYEYSGSQVYDHSEQKSFTCHSGKNLFVGVLHIIGRYAGFRLYLWHFIVGNGSQDKFEIRHGELFKL